MATKYARLRAVLEVSDASDYSRPKTHSIEVTATPDEFRLEDEIEVATAGQTYRLDHLSSLSGPVIIKNIDSTNYMTVAYTNVAAGTNTIRIAAGQTAIIPGGDITASGNLTLTANTSAVLVEISYLGT